MRRSMMEAFTRTTLHEKCTALSKRHFYKWVLLWLLPLIFCVYKCLFSNILSFTFSLQTLQRGNKDCQQRRIILARQQIFIMELVKLVKMVARESGNRIKKVWPFLSWDSILSTSCTVYLEEFYLTQCLVFNFLQIERLQSLFQDAETFMINFVNIEPLPFPLNPDIYIKGIVAES